MATSKALLIGSTIALVTFLTTLAVFLFFICRNRRNSASNGPSHPTTHSPPFSRFLRHTRKSSDASRLLLLNAPSEPSHDGHGLRGQPDFPFQWTPLQVEAQSFNQPDYTRQYAHSVGTTFPSADGRSAISASPPSMAQAQSYFPALTASATANALPIGRRPSPEQRDRSLSVSTAATTTPVRLLPPLPQPSPSERTFHLNRHLPSLFIPNSPYSDSPLASSVRLTPGPLSAFLSPPTGSRNDADNVSPSLYSQRSNSRSNSTDYGGKNPNSPPITIISPPLSQDRTLYRLNTGAVSQMLQARSKAARRAPSRALKRSSSLASRLGRQNSILSVLSTADVAETPENEEFTADEPHLTALAPITNPPDPTLTRKRSRSESTPKQTRLRLLPPTPLGPSGSVVQPSGLSSFPPAPSHQSIPHLLVPGQHGHSHDRTAPGPSFVHASSVAMPTTSTGSVLVRPATAESTNSTKRSRPPLPVPPMAIASSTETGFATPGAGELPQSGLSRPPRAWRALPPIGPS